MRLLVIVVLTVWCVSACAQRTVPVSITIDQLSDLSHGDPAPPPVFECERESK